MRGRMVGPLGILLALLAACDGSGGQLNDAANLVRPVNPNKDQLAKPEGVLTITPTPFTPGATVTALARFNQPQKIDGNGKCSEPDVHEYWLQFIPLDESGAPRPALNIPRLAPYANAANGARIGVSFDLAAVPARTHPGLRATASFYQRYCAAIAGPGGPVDTIQSSDTRVAHADFTYQCGREQAKRCAYYPVAKP